MGSSNVDVWHMKTPYGPLVVSRGDQGGTMALHRHVRPHCVFTLRGHYCEGLQQMTGRIWQAGDVTVFPARYRHRTWFAEGDVMLAALRLTTTTMSELGLSGLTGTSTSHMDKGVREALSLALLGAKDASACNENGLRVFALVEAALLSVHGSDASTHWLDDVRAALERASACPPSLQVLADGAARNPSYLSHAFKRRYGVTIRQYVRRTRVRKAAALLADRACSVTEAAHAAGFDDASHLAHAFRSLSRTTATQFRGAVTTTRSISL